MNAVAALSANPSSVNAGAGLCDVGAAVALGRSFVASGPGDDDARGTGVAYGEADSESGAAEGVPGVGCASGDAVAVALGVGVGGAGAGFVAGACFAAGGWAEGCAGDGAGGAADDADGGVVCVALGDGLA
jgi:hypothetical protein